MRQLIHYIHRPSKCPEKPANEAAYSEIVALSQERISASSMSVTGGMCVCVLLPRLR